LGSSPGAPSQPASNIGEGKVKAGLILPLSASGGMKAAGPNWQGAFALTSTNRRIANVAVRHSLETAEGEAAINPLVTAYATEHNLQNEPLD